MPNPPKFTPLTSQRKEGSKLLGPFGSLQPKFDMINWPRDLLPEHLWIAALAEKFGMEALPSIYNAFLDALDKHWPHKFVALGLVSDFGLVPIDQRASFLETNSIIVDNFFHDPNWSNHVFVPRWTRCMAHSR